MNGLRNYVKHSKEFHPISTQLEVGSEKKLGASFLLTHFSVFGNRIKHPSFRIEEVLVKKNKKLKKCEHAFCKELLKLPEEAR